MPGVDAPMVVVPADKPLMASCAELGHGGIGSLERYRVTRRWRASELCHVCIA